MLPYLNYDLVRAIHEDRMRAAQRPVPEWFGIDAARARKQSDTGARRFVCIAFARALRQLAASLDPHSPAVNA
jgi:hypothetical protein